MWLLNARTSELEAFEGHSPPYAILSHRWQQDEVSFQDVMRNEYTHKQGYGKVKGFCDLVLHQQSIPNTPIRWSGVEYVWIDTCCINKESSAELSEAINSMYQWYQNARVCCVFLPDVTSLDSLQKSAWFSRGWTLQELLAPSDTQFYNCAWEHLGSTRSLCDEIVNITGIPRDAINRTGPFVPAKFSIAERMSWASKRQTTRVEDIAYSLLGIFEVNMPLLYGEGEKAFYRLQMTILQTSRDPSILAWTADGMPDFGTIARSPSSFSFDKTSVIGKLTAENYEPARDNRARLQSQGSVASSVGVSMTLMMIPYFLNIWLVPVGILEQHSARQSVSGNETDWMYIAIQRDSADGLYRKIRVDGQHHVRLPSQLIDQARVRTITFGRAKPSDLSLSSTYRFKIQTCDLPRKTFKSTEVLSRQADNNTFEMRPGQIGVAGMLRLHISGNTTKYFLLGHDFGWNVFCLCLTIPGHHTGSDMQLLFPNFRRKTFQLFSSKDMAELVHWMQDIGAYSGPRYSFRLWQISWTETRERMTTYEPNLQVSIRPVRDSVAGYYVVNVRSVKDFDALASESSGAEKEEWYARSYHQDPMPELTPPVSLSQTPCLEDMRYVTRMVSPDTGFGAL